MVGLGRAWWPAWVAAALTSVCLLSACGAGNAAPRRPNPPPKNPSPGVPLPWLGINYNSTSETGSLREFAARGIVYDRLGTLEVPAGTTTANNARFRAGLETSYRAGMIPVIEVNTAAGRSGCIANPVPTDLCLPTDPRQVASYVRGFVGTVTSVLRTYPGRRVLFEPTNEPWLWASPPGSPPGRSAAKQYGAILAQLLPAARAARVP